MKEACVEGHVVRKSKHGIKSAKPIICETFSLKLRLITCRNWSDLTLNSSEQMRLNLMADVMPRTSQSLLLLLQENIIET